MNTQDNYTKMPNELIEILMSEAISKHEARVLLFMARKIYGFNKTSDQISLSQFQNKLGLSRQGVVSILKRLELVNICRLVNKGNSKLASSEWLIDTSNYADKLVKLSRLERFGRPKTPQNSLKPVNIPRLVNMARPTIVVSSKENVNTFTAKEDFWDLNIKSVLSTLKGISPEVVEESRAAFILNPNAQLKPNYMRGIIANKQKEPKKKGGIKDAASTFDPFTIRGGDKNARVS